MALERQGMTRFGTEERNMNRLSPVISLNRIPDGMVGWTKRTQIDQYGAIDVTCLAGRNHVVPHGLDADTLFAMTTLYFLQGKPEFGRITVSVRELCDAAGLEPSGNTYERIRESLQRWLKVTYEVTDCWASPSKNGKWNFRSLSFGVVTSVQQIDLDVDSSELLGQFQATTMLEITLSPQLIDSMAVGHIRTVDLEFYASLKSPLSRILYRTLEEQRTLSETGKDRYSIPVSAWGDHLGMRTLSEDSAALILDTRTGNRIPATEVMSATKIRRALTPAHNELMARGYLKTVDYVGRGQAQRLDYKFSSGAPTQPVDLELVGLLARRHVNQKQAEKFAKKYRREEIEAAAEKYDTRISNGYTPRNPGGFLADILADPEKYPEIVREEQAKRVLNPAAVVAQPQPEPSVPERTEGAAHMALTTRFTENDRLRGLRSRATTLFLNYQVNLKDLMALVMLEPSQIEQTISEWETRRAP